MAEHKGLTNFQRSTQDQVVLICLYFDSCIIHKQAGRYLVPTNVPVLWDLMQWTISNGTLLRALLVAESQNVMADVLSRGKVVPTEWTLYQVVV